MFQGPLQLPAVASSSAPIALVPGQACSGLPSLITGACVVVTWVGGSSVRVSPSTLTVPVAGWPDGEPSAREGCVASTSVASAHAGTSAEQKRAEIDMSRPLSTRACGLRPKAGLLTPGPTLPRLPEHAGGGPVAACRMARRGGHPRSQWRVRAGFAPASLHHRPYERADLTSPHATRACGSTGRMR